MVKAKVWVLKNRPAELPAEKDFQCIEENLPTCSDGDVIIEAEYLSVDPYMRYQLNSIELGTCIPGSQVSKVIESKNKDYPVGSYIVGYPGWRSHSHIDAEGLKGKNPFSFPYLKVPDMAPLSRSTALGVLGMPGNTAYFGLLDICKPKPGETVVVSTAAGAVGSSVCQIAKITGCKVIGFTGSEEKVKWVKELGVDHVFNYKTCNVSESLKAVAPEGVHCYFDNVGGQFTANVLPHMALFGRVSICGCISTYNNPSKPAEGSGHQSPYVESTLLMKQLKVEGFIVSRWKERWNEGINQMKAWIAQGKLKYKESTTVGFENMPRTFIGLFHGENFGKAIVKA